VKKVLFKVTCSYLVLLCFSFLVSGGALWGNCKRQTGLPLNDLISGEPFGVATFFYILFKKI